MSKSRGRVVHKAGPSGCNTARKLLTSPRWSDVTCSPCLSQRYRTAAEIKLEKQAHVSTKRHVGKDEEE